MQWDVDQIPSFDWGRYNIITSTDNYSTIELIDENSFIGNKSIKLDRHYNVDSISYIRMKINNDESFINKTATLLFNVYSDNTINILFNLNNSSGTVIDNVSLNVPSTSNSWSQDVTLSKVIPEGCSILDFRIQIPKTVSSITAYVDNFRILIQ